MSDSKALRRVVAGFVGFAAIVLIAWAGYRGFGCQTVDALFMVIITVFGIGYGELCPVSDNERLFTVFVIVAGTGSVLFTFGGFIQLMTEGELHRALDQRRKTLDIAGLRDHVILCGFNHIGQVLAKQLMLARLPFVIVEENAQALVLAEEAGYRVCQGTATDEATLLLARIDTAKTLCTVLPNDADNLFITLTARGLNRELVILSRGDVPSTEKKLRQAGADHVILPAAISGMQMANLITQPTAVDFLNQSSERRRLGEMLGHLDLQIDELTISENTAIDGLTIAEIEVKGNGIFIVIALRKANGETITQPDAGETLSTGDTLIVLGRVGDMPQFTRRHGVSHPSRYLSGARG